MQRIFEQDINGIKSDNGILLLAMAILQLRMTLPEQLSLILRLLFRGFFTSSIF